MQDDHPSYRAQCGATIEQVSAAIRESVGTTRTVRIPWSETAERYLRDECESEEDCVGGSTLYRGSMWTGGDYDDESPWAVRLVRGDQ